MNDYIYILFCRDGDIVCKFPAPQTWPVEERAELRVLNIVGPFDSEEDVKCWRRFGRRMNGEAAQLQ